MRIGLVDVDGHNFPNLAIGKIAAFHKSIGDTVEWANPLFGNYDRVYMSKVFTFTPDYPHPINARKIIKGGTGYFYPNGGNPLNEDVEHCYPDYSLYPELCKNAAQGWLTSG